MTIKKIVSKNEGLMLKHKIPYGFLVNLFFLVHTMMGMNSGSPYAYDDYVPPIVLCTHKINRCFWNASLLIEASPEELRDDARKEINKCYSFISNLEKIIKDFSQLPLRRLLSELETLAKHSSDKKTKNIIIQQIIPRLSSFDPANDNIDAILSALSAIKSMNSTNDVVHSLISSLSTIQLSMNATNNIVNSIVSSFSAIRDQLDKLNSPINTPDEFRTGLLNIMAQYDSIFSKFKSTPSLPRYRRPQGMMSIASNIVFKDILSTHHQKIQNLLSEKNDIMRQLKIEPQLLQPPIKEVIAKFSLLSKVLARVPLLERLFCWVLNNYNEMVKKLMGARTYDGIKNNTVFHCIRRLHEKNLIRAANIDNLLNNPTADKVIDLVCKENQAFIDYCNNLQKYYCIELLECLHRSHDRSQEMLQRENQHFSFDYEHAIVPNDNTKDRKLQQNKIKWIVSNIQGGATKLFSGIKNAATTTVALAKLLKKAASLNGIQNVANTSVELATSFVSSLFPWYQPPTNVIPINAQPEVIVAQQQALGITDFLLEINRNNNKQPINAVRNFPSSQTDAISRPLITLNKGEDNLWFYSVDSQLEIKELEIKEKQPTLNAQSKIKEKALLDMIHAHTMLEQGYSRKYQEYKKTITTPAFAKASSDTSAGRPLPDEWNSVPSQIDTLYQSLIKLDEERKNLWFFDIWNKRTNQQERNKITNILQHHIDAYNMAKINLYTQDKFYETFCNKSSPYTKSRKNFLENLTLSPKDNNDIFMLSRGNSCLKDYRHILSPLEQSEMSRSRLQIQ